MAYFRYVYHSNRITSRIGRLGRARHLAYRRSEYGTFDWSAKYRKSPSDICNSGTIFKRTAQKHERPVLAAACFVDGYFLPALCVITYSATLQEVRQRGVVDGDPPRL